MPNYDLSSMDTIAASANQAHIRAILEPSQNSYNAAWLHGYASALADCAEQLEPQQEFIDAIIGYLGEQHDSAELYEILHDCLDLSAERIKALGFDLPECAEPTPEIHDHKTQRRNPSHER